MDSGSPAFPFDVSFGVAFTTNYVSRGITNSGDHPAVQGYIEPSIGPLYLNVWSSNVDFGEDFEGAEIDTAIGVRPEFGPLSLDLGYVHYFYAPKDVSPDYGELFAKADYNFNDRFTLGARVFFAPDYNQSGDTATFVAGGIKVPLPHDFSVYAGIGYQFFEDPDGVRATRLDGGRFLQLESPDLRRPLLGYRSQRRRMRGAQWFRQWLRRPSRCHGLTRYRLVDAEGSLWPCSTVREPFRELHALMMRQSDDPGCHVNRPAAVAPGEQVGAGAT